VISVRTIDRARFRDGCGTLWDLAQAGLQPQLVVGIRSGGWWVVEAMIAARAPANVVFLPLTCRRPTSDIKGGSATFRFLLRVLPYFILNILRTVEYYLLTLPRCRAARRHGVDDQRIPDPAEIGAIRAAARDLPADVRVLVVDDSIDSGATLHAVMRQLRELLPPAAELRTAAFTVLGPYPVVAADFALYQRVNCRFPWSYDFHG
jgi:hypothetical protein